MKKRILAILLAIALLSSVVAVVAYADSFTCNSCGQTFSTESALNSHISSQHPTIYSCSKCGAQFTSTTDLNAHITSQHPIFNYHCSLCKDNPGFTTLEQYNDHLAKVHPSLDYECSVCHQGFASADDLKAHYELMHKQDTNALQCPYCKFIAPNISAYNDHLAANHQKDGEQVTPRDNAERFFDKYVMGIGLNVDTNSFSSVVRVFAYITEVLMSVFTDSGASEVFQFAGDSGVTYFFETIVPHFWSIFTGA